MIQNNMTCDNDSELHRFYGNEDTVADKFCGLDIHKSSITACIKSEKLKEHKIVEIDVISSFMLCVFCIDRDLLKHHQLCILDVLRKKFLILKQISSLEALPHLFKM